MRGSRLALDDGVGEGADAVDGDVHNVAGEESEIVGWDDAGAGEKENAVGEGVFASKPADEVVESAGHFGQASFAFEDGGRRATNDQFNADFFNRRHEFGQGNTRAEAAALVVNFRLGKV